MAMMFRRTGQCNQECPILVHPMTIQGRHWGEAVPFWGGSHRRLRLVGIDRPVSEAPSMEISSLLPPTVPVPSRAVSKRSNGARNVVPRVAGVVEDSTLVDPESGERALESAVHAPRSVSEDVHGALEFNLWTPRDSEDGAVLQDPRRMSQCPTVAAESGEIGMAHVSPRVSTSVVSCRGVAQRASMVHAAVSSNRFSALVDDEVEVHPDSGSETVSMGDVEQVREVESDEDTQSCSVVSGEEESEDISEDPLEIPAPPVGGVRAAFLQMDEVDLVHHFSMRVVVMKAVPRFLTGPFRNALNIALAEATVGNRVQDLARQERGWKLFLLLPRLLLHRPRGGVISHDKLQLRFAKFAEASGSNCCKKVRSVTNEQPQRATANDTIVNMIWSDAGTRHSSWFSLVSSLQPGLLLRGPKLHLGMTTHSDLWRTPLDDLPLHVIPFLRIWSISGLLLSSPWMKHCLQEHFGLREGQLGGRQG